MSGRKKPGRGGTREGAGRPAGSGEFDGSLRLRVPAELIARIDAAAGDAGMSRADWARRALEAALVACLRCGKHVAMPGDPMAWCAACVEASAQARAKYAKRHPRGGP